MLRKKLTMACGIYYVAGQNDLSSIYIGILSI